MLKTLTQNIKKHIILLINVSKGDSRLPLKTQLGTTIRKNNAIQPDDPSLTCVKPKHE